MKPVVLLAPLVALVAVTGLVWLTMLVQRAQAMRRLNIKPQDMPTRVLADQKFGDAQAANNALMNLFELPVLFYVLLVVLLALGQGDALYVAAAWIFVALRGVQAAVHVTCNDVLHRGLAYLASATVLWLMWARFAWTLFVAT